VALEARQQDPAGRRVRLPRRRDGALMSRCASRSSTSRSTFFVRELVIDRSISFQMMMPMPMARAAPAATS
jgi:hypothetical protein